MAGFVPGRDQVTLDAMDPEGSRERQAAETAERRAELDKRELAELEREQTSVAVSKRNRSLLDRMLRRG
jgi:hypothetical protein